MHIVIHPKYAFLEQGLKSLADREYFENNGHVIHRGRNTIKTFEIDGIRLCVKSYEQMTTFNRAIYGRLRKSKSLRAYTHALRLLHLGIDTPQPIAVIDIHRNGLLRYSYFVSLYSDFSPAAHITDSTRGDFSVHGADALCYWIVKLHSVGVLHKDLNISNILYKQDSDGAYRFQVIDVNRMSFHRSISLNRRIKNLHRLSCDNVAFMYILGRYAALCGIDVEDFQAKGFFSRIMFQLRMSHKQILKGFLKKILKK